MRIAIVRAEKLELFGLYTDSINHLKRLGEVIEIYGSPIGEELAAQLEGIDVAITEPMLPKFTSDFFKFNRSVKMIYVHGRGYDNVDIYEAKRRGVLVARVPGWCENEAVAEHAVAMLLEAVKKLSKAREFVKSGEWLKKGESFSEFSGKSLRSMTIGIIGFGYIGSRTAQILRLGFNARVLVYDPHVPKEKVEDMGFEYREELDDLLQESDAISIHAELNDETYHMINSTRIEKMKNGVIIVNTARGAIIDTPSLTEGLRKGKIGYAALDVVEGEPIDKDHPLLKFSNVLITPHVAYATNDAINCMGNAVVNAVRAFISGKPVWETIVPGLTSS